MDDREVELFAKAFRSDLDDAEREIEMLFQQTMWESRVHFIAAQKKHQARMRTILVIELLVLIVATVIAFWL